MASWQEHLSSLYSDPSKAGSFQSAEKLYQTVRKEGQYNITRYQIKKWLQNQESFSLHKAQRRKFQRTPIIVSGTDDQWSADLMDMGKYAKHNNKVKYILLVIDTFSKFLWLRPLKDKTGASVTEAFADIFREGRTPNRLRTDKGQEFRASSVKNLMNSKNIKQMFAQNENKASISERAIKTIKSKIVRYLTHNNTFQYIDQLQKFSDSYNKTLHRTIDMAPANVSKDNEEDIRITKYFQSIPKKKISYKFKVGDKVRITYLRNIFSREYDQKWTGEVFTISQRFRRGPIPIYRLKDYNEEPITGSFYQSELQKVSLTDDNLFKIEKILKERGRGQDKEYLVKWLYWPKKFNSWIKGDAVEQI